MTKKTSMFACRATDGGTVKLLFDSGVCGGRSLAGIALCGIMGGQNRVAKFSRNEGVALFEKHRKYYRPRFQPINNGFAC